jgi:DNA-binding beta-propeller fold protein YncE
MALAASPDGRTLWTADTTAAALTALRARDGAKRRTIALPDAPIDLALTPDGRRALVLLGFYERPALAIVDLAAGRVIGRHDVGRAARAIVLSRDGRTAYVTGGGQHGWLRRVDARTGAAGRAVAIGRHPRDLALTADGRHVLVTLNGDAVVAVVARRDDHLVTRISTAPFPGQIAAAPRGDRAVVTHDGFGGRAVSFLDIGTLRVARTAPTGPDPAGVAYVGARKVLVAERGRGNIAVLDAHTGARRRRIRTGGWPRAVVVADGRIFVVDEQTGRLSALGVR